MTSLTASFGPTVISILTRSELPDPIQIHHKFGLLLESEGIPVCLQISHFLRAGIRDVWAESVFLGRKLGEENDRIKLF